MSLASRVAALTTAALALTGVTVGITGGTATAAPCTTPGGLTTLVATGSAGGSSDSPYLCAQEGELLDVRIGDVRATQPSLGYDEVYYKLGRYTLGKDAINKKFEDWCEANGQGTAVAATPEARLSDPGSFTCAVAVGQETPETIAPMKTVVVGPGGLLYLTDGHHTLTSFQEVEGPDVHVRLRVLGNLSALSIPDFWAQMQTNRWVWNHDVDGKEVAYAALPQGVGLANFADDRYRSLMYFGRDIGYTAGTIPFQEFYWGEWLRGGGAGDLGGWDNHDSASYLAAVDRVTHAQTALPTDSVVNNGFTASQLGVLGAWNDGKAADKGEFGKLSKPYSDAKPGKIAYALEYKAAHGK